MNNVLHKHTEHSLTQLAHQRCGVFLREGDRAIDLTAGNGHDALFLAESVGKTGHVLAVDCQVEAIERSRQRLLSAEMLDRVDLYCGDHAALRGHMPHVFESNVSLVMMNLGYLPGGDHSIKTQSKSTLKALEFAWDRLRAGGALSLIAYRGHAGGVEEYEAVESWLDGLGVAVEGMGNREHPVSPVWFWVTQ